MSYPCQARMWDWIRSFTHEAISLKLDEEFYRMLDGVVIDDAKLFNEKLKEWENFYNYNRPHAALGG